MGHSDSGLLVVVIIIQYDDAEDNEKGGLNAVRVSLLWSDPCCHLLLCNTMVYQWLYGSHPREQHSLFSHLLRLNQGRKGEIMKKEITNYVVSTVIPSGWY